MNTNKNTAAVIGGMANRYELRSKRKEGLEPKLKEEEIEVKEVNGSKGRKKRAVLPTSTAAAASDGVNVTDGSGDPASIEMTFSIDHIREQIFHSLLNSDLKNCFLVCRSWNSFASLELQSRIERTSFDFGMKEVSEFLSLLNKRPKSMLGFPLPCSNFRFNQDTYSATFLKNRAMLKFLDKYGPAIKELSFVSEFCDDPQPKEKEVIEFVTKLLLHQTPNLSKLEIMFDYSASCARGGSTRKWDSTLLTSDPEFKEIHSKTWETNINMKVLTLEGVSAKLLEVVIQLAPNLREINAKGYYSNGNDCKYFVEPLNRLGLLKKIHFNPNSMEDFQVYEKVCELSQSGDTSLKLREIYFYVDSDIEDDDEFPYIRARTEKVINRLLECSWDSLETIEWYPSTGLSGLKWPEELPNVQELTIMKLTIIKFDNHVFPSGFSWSTTFPKLRRVFLNNVIGEPSFTDVMDLLFQEQKVESVKVVDVYAREDWRKKDQLTRAQLKRLKSIFPNAAIEGSLPALFTPLWAQEKCNRRRFVFEGFDCGKQV